MKTVCIYHSRDLDGWMSAAIVKHWWSNSPKAIDNNNDNLDYIGYDYGQPIPILEEYDRIIMCDISFPKEEMRKLYHTVDQEFTWIDHHISAINDYKTLDLAFPKGLQDINYAACELTWKFFFDEPIPELVRLLGRYDCFGHKGTDEEKRVLEFQYGARQVITNYEEAYNWLYKSLGHHPNNNPYLDRIQINGEAIYAYLCTEAKEIYSRAFAIGFNDKIGDSYSDNEINDFTIKRSFLCVNQDRFNPINFGIDYHKAGYEGFACFWYKDGRWNFSLYNDNGLVDCSNIAKRYGGGGHKGAAGFVVTDLDMVFNVK